MTSFSHVLNKPATRYLTPFIVFILLTECQRWVSGPSLFALYAFKSFATLLVFCWLFKDHAREIEGSFDIKAVVLGIFVLFLWILPVEMRARPETAAAFDPSTLPTIQSRILGIAFRIAGAALVVPIMEELIWRSFLMRYLIKNDFTSVKLGTYTAISFWGTVLAFMLVHRPFEWPVAFVTGVLYGAYLVKTKNLVGCMIAHGVTNLGLGIFVLMTGKYYYW